MPRYSGAERDRQIDALAHTIMGEAQDQSYEGMLGVGNNIMNRAAINFSGYGTDPYSQAHAPNQYSAWNDAANAGNRGVRQKISAAALAAATAAVDGTAPDNTGGSTYYNRADGAGVSNKGKARQAADPNAVTIQDHAFYNYNTTEPQAAAIRDRFANPESSTFNPAISPAQAAIDSAQRPAPQTLGERMRETLGLPTTLGIQAVNGVISLGQLAEAAAANVAAQSAAAQNPQAAPPSSFPSRPAGPVSSNQFNQQGSALPGAVAQGPDLSSPLGRMNAAIGRNPNAGVSSATPTNDYRDTPQDRMRAAVGAPPAASYQGPGQRGFSPPTASSYDTLGMTAGPTGFSTGGMFSAGPQAMGAAMGSFAKAAPKASPQAYGGPTAAADASNRPQATTMPMGFNPQSTVGMDIGNQLTDPTTSFTHVPPQAAMDEANLSAQISSALSTGYAPGAVKNVKPGEPGYQAPAPSVPKLAPKMPQKQAAPAPVAARPLAPPQSQFAPQTPVYNGLGSIVGAIGQAGKAYTPDFAPNTSVYNQNGQVVGSISGRTTQASPLSSGGLASLGGLFNNGSAALGSLGGFASAIGGYNSGDSNAYGHTVYGTRAYGGNGGSTLGGGDTHRAL